MTNGILELPATLEEALKTGHESVSITNFDGKPVGYEQLETMKAGDLTSLEIAFCGKNIFTEYDWDRKQVTLSCEQVTKGKGFYAYCFEKKSALPFLESVYELARE